MKRLIVGDGKWEVSGGLKLGGNRVLGRLFNVKSVSSRKDGNESHLIIMFYVL